MVNLQEGQVAENGSNGNELKLDIKDSNEITNKDEDTAKQQMPKRVAMYCTGGIRCEKASSFLLSKGFKEVTLILDSCKCQ